MNTFSGSGTNIGGNLSVDESHKMNFFGNIS